MSGKGGVGKSTLTVNLAAVLARKSHAVGILDGDINGGSVAKMMGVRAWTPRATSQGMLPAEAEFGIRVMSIDLFLPQDATPVLWRAPSQEGAYHWRTMMDVAALREMLSDTKWGALDILFIDLPPGADKLPNASDVVPKLSGTVVVTGPSDVSRLVVGRSMTMARDVVHTPVIGLIENMGPYTCSRCGHEEELFPSGHARRLAEEHDVEYLGCVPFDPRLSRAMDDGGLFATRFPDRPASRALSSAADRVAEFLGLLPQSSMNGHTS